MNLKIDSQRLSSNLDFMRDWVRKSLENIRVNQQYYQIPTDERSLDPEVQEAIHLALKKDDEYSNFKLRKHYDICEFSTETRKDELKDTSQQLFMINFVNTSYHLFKSQQQRIQLLEERLSELENPKFKTI